MHERLPLNRDVIGRIAIKDQGTEALEIGSIELQVLLENIGSPTAAETITVWDRGPILTKREKMLVRISKMWKEMDFVRKVAGRRQLVDRFVPFWRIDKKACMHVGRMCICTDSYGPVLDAVISGELALTGCWHVTGTPEHAKSVWQPAVFRPWSDKQRLATLPMKCLCSLSQKLHQIISLKREVS